MSSPEPTTFTDILEFVSSRTENALSDNPDVAELTDFANGCNQTFVTTFGDDTAMVPTPALMRTVVHLSNILTMPDVMADLTDLQANHAILSASVFSHAIAGRGLNSISLVVDPLEKLVNNPVKFHGDLDAEYGARVPQGVREYVVGSALKICCIISTMWGFFTAYEEPTMRDLFQVMNNWANGTLPTALIEQREPSFSRNGAVVGWNAAIHAIERVFRDHMRRSRASQSLEAHKALMQSCLRGALSFTATSFARGVEEWKWSDGITFDRLNAAFNTVFQGIVQQICDYGDDDILPAFSLNTDTREVRQARTLPSGQQMQQQPLDAQGRSQASIILNVRPNVLNMLSLERPAKRSRIDLRDPPPAQPTPQIPDTQPPPPPPPFTQAEIDRNNVRAQAAEQMRQNLAQRERNRRRNRLMTPTVTWNNHRFSIRQIRSILDGRHPLAFEHDNPDSENEEIEHEQELQAAQRAQRSGNVEERISVEKCMLFVLNLHVDPIEPPTDSSDDSIVKDYGTVWEHFLWKYLDTNRDCFLYEATRALNTDMYSDHLKAVLHMEIHFQVQRALFETFPDARRGSPPTTMPIRDELLDNRQTHRYFVVRIDNVARSKALIEFATHPYSVSHNVRRTLVREFPGHTLCIGIVMRPQRGRRPISRLSFLICRSISHSAQELDPVAVDDDAMLDNVTIKLTASRYHLDRFEPQEGDIIRLIPVCSLVSTLRQLKSIHASHTLPDKLQQILFGTSFQDAVRLPDIKPPTSRQELEASFEPLQSIRDRVDQGCLDYIDRLQPEQCDQSQRRALLTSLGEIGDMEANSSSLSMINGPPGCGKSWTIALLCMSLLHHSVTGHVRPGATYPSILPEPEKKLRCSNNRNGLKILVTCPCNVGVDEVARKLREQLPMSDGTTMRPYIVRIGRNNYDFKDLADISLHHLAMKYERHLNPVEEGDQDAARQQRNPGREATEALVSEACIFLTTNSTAAGPMLTKLGVTVSCVIVDEAAHASEGETLMSIMANVRMAQEGRVHAVLVGDQMQLGPVFMCSHAAINFVRINRSFRFRPSMKRQFESLFERLYRTDRCKTTWLTHHYRSHPDLAAVTLSYQYSDILSFPLPPANFESAYTNVQGPNGINLVVVIDTRLSMDRYEGRRDGSDNGPLLNDLECDVAHEFLWRLYRERGDADLRNEIIVASPYVLQTNNLREKLTSARGFCSNDNRSPRLNVTIDTTDSLQGSQRDVAVISLTRSNRARHVGFLNDERRLNVAFSRPRKVLCIIGDFSTMQRCKIANYVFQSALQNYPRTSLQFYQPPQRRIDRLQQSQVQRFQR